MLASSLSYRPSCKRYAIVWRLAPRAMKTTSCLTAAMATASTGPLHFHDQTVLNLSPAATGPVQYMNPSDSQLIPSVGREIFELGQEYSPARATLLCRDKATSSLFANWEHVLLPIGAFRESAAQSASSSPVCGRQTYFDAAL